MITTISSEHPTGLHSRAELLVLLPAPCGRRNKTATGARAFGVVAPKVWHDLPDSIDTINGLHYFI